VHARNARSYRGLNWMGARRWGRLGACQLFWLATPRPFSQGSGFIGALLNNPSKLARLVDSNLECVGAKLGDFGRRDA
jgi:hypothetical protein